jgi:hypothetical protein
LTATGFDWAIVREIAVAIMALGVGIGVFLVCTALAGVLKRTNRTLDEVDKLIASLQPPIAETLTHVGGIAGTADTTLARLGGVIGQLESVADGVGKTSRLATTAIGPVIVNVGATLTGISAGLRRFAAGRRTTEPDNGTTL